jgi:Bacterial RNA polymerase, alpha chain C terminal domain
MNRNRTPWPLQAHITFTGSSCRIDYDRMADFGYLSANIPDHLIVQKINDWDLSYGKEGFYSARVSSYYGEGGDHLWDSIATHGHADALDVIEMIGVALVAHVKANPLKASVETLNLPTRVLNVLIDADYKDINSLICDGSRGLRRCNNLGKVGRAEIVAALKQIGIELTDDSFKRETR